jgi:glucose/mannose-6-phosphate isomerase
MLDLVAQLPDQLLLGRGLAVEVLEDSPRRVRRAVVCGMGGSAAAGELARGVFRDGPLAVDVCRSYVLPGGIDQSVLLVFSSYSGNTEETLAAYTQSAAFPRARRLVIASGGELLARAGRDGVPAVRLPGELPPRASLGYSVGALFTALGLVGAAGDVATQLDEAAATLREAELRLGAHAPAADNPARQLARRLYGKVPLLYAGAGLAEAVAWRWKAQINENAKAMAFVSVLPELDHNEVVGWESATRARDELFVVALRDAQDHPGVQRRFNVTRDILGDRVRGWESVETRGLSATARAMGLVQYGDYLSVYLAGEYGVDPVPVESIDRLKQKLADLG